MKFFLIDDNLEMMYNSPEALIQAIKNAWEQGDLPTAQKLAFQSVEHYPKMRKS